MLLVLFCYIIICFEHTYRRMLSHYMECTYPVIMSTEVVSISLHGVHISTVIVSTDVVSISLCGVHVSIVMSTEVVSISLC